MIVVGHHELLPNTANQTIEISVSGGDAVQGLGLYVQVGDGGPDLTGSDEGPNITEIDALTGTIFDGNNTGQFLLGSFDLFRAVSVTTGDGSVGADGLLATITFDTRDIDSGSWPLLLGSTAVARSDFAGIPIEITEGSITVVPEPATVVMMVQAAAFCVFLAFCRVKRRLPAQ